MLTTRERFREVRVTVFDVLTTSKSFFLPNFEELYLPEHSCVSQNVGFFLKLRSEILRSDGQIVATMTFHVSYQCSNDVAEPVIASRYQRLSTGAQRLRRPIARPADAPTNPSLPDAQRHPNTNAPQPTPSHASWAGWDPDCMILLFYCFQLRNVCDLCVTAGTNALNAHWKVYEP